MAPLKDVPAMEDPNGELERIFIEEFLRSHGYDRDTVNELPEPQRTRLLSQACIYAAARLAELEARVHYLHDIHGATGH